MRIARPAGIVLLLALIAGTAAPPPTADEIRRRHIEAIGGATRWQNVQSLLVRGTSTYGSFLWVWKKPDLMRSEERDPSGSGLAVITASDGGSGWISDSFHGPSTPRRLQRDELQRWQTGFPVRSSLLDLPERGATLTLLGSERLRDRDTWKLSLERPGRDRVLLWIDAESYLLLQRARTLKTPWGGDEIVATPFSDYRNVRGVLIPHAVGQTHCLVDVNADVADSLFQPPRPLP